MFNILSLIFKYIFIVIIYLFILSIIRLIYLDIKGISRIVSDGGRYLKLVNKKESLSFNVQEYYPVMDKMVIGRSSSNEIPLKDPYISKKHVRFIEDEGLVFLEDLKSANGSYVNGDRIMDVVRLKNGDRIKLGQVEFLYVDRE